MANSSSIWLTWNAVTGCTLWSDGCKNCYAKGMALKWQKLGVKKYANGFDITLHEDALFFPKKTKRPSIIFANSMTDLFHKDIPFEYLQKVFDIMSLNKQHLFFVLTKRAERMLELSKKLNIGENIWMGVTIESQKYIHRIDLLKQVKSKYKYIVCEPLLSQIDLGNLEGIDWITGGNESGPNRRPVKETWVENINEQCKKYNIPFSFKLRGRKDTFFGRKNYYGTPEIIEEFEKKSHEYAPKKNNENQISFDF